MKKYLYILCSCLVQSTLISFAQGKHSSMQDTIKLSDVTIMAEKNLVQRKADRMIVSVEHNKLLKSRSLSSILSLIPDVDYDGDGGIRVMGNGVKIYENGKAVNLSGKQLKRYLSSLHGNDIKNLEILPRATAEYDAEGGTAILIVNRQKRHEYGLFGYVGNDYERKSKNSCSEFMGLTYSWGKLALYGNMSMGHSESKSITYENDYGQNLTVVSKSESADKGRYYMPKLGLDFNISPKQYLGVEWSGSYSKDYSNACWLNSSIVDKSIYPTNINTFAPLLIKRQRQQYYIKL